MSTSQPQIHTSLTLTPTGWGITAFTTAKIQIGEEQTMDLDYNT